MNIVVDANIIFSTLLNSNSNIADLLFNSGETFDFYSSSYMRHEIQKHWERLKKISKLSEEQLQISYTHVLSKLNFINEEIIPVKTWLASEQLTRGIDIDAARATVITTKQSDAISVARDIARNNSSELIVHGRDGKIRERNSYGNDPYPP
ncbi:MAG: DUF2188 domain-containing protein [Ferruginibacter sp.]